MITIDLRPALFVETYNSRDLLLHRMEMPRRWVILQMPCGLYVVTGTCVSREMKITFGCHKSKNLTPKMTVNGFNVQALTPNLTNNDRFRRFVNGEGGGAGGGHYFVRIILDRWYVEC